MKQTENGKVLWKSSWLGRTFSWVLRKRDFFKEFHTELFLRRLCQQPIKSEVKISLHTGSCIVFSRQVFMHKAISSAFTNLVTTSSKEHKGSVTPYLSFYDLNLIIRRSKYSSTFVWEGGYKQAHYFYTLRPILSGEKRVQSHKFRLQGVTSCHRNSTKRSGLKHNHKCGRTVPQLGLLYAPDTVHAKCKKRVRIGA
jgi:hypothetical protein